MSAAEQVALAHYRQRRQLIDALAAVARRAWRRVDRDDIARSWAAQLVEVVALTNAAQLAAARTADDYLDQVLDVQGINPAREGRLVPASVAGVASDGRTLAGLLYEPAVGTLSAIKAGADVDRALAGGYALLDMMVRTQLADAGRTADQVALAARRHVGGYVRMVVGNTCGRCVVLAGKWYRYNAGFRRHPRCDCIHVPASEDTGRDIRTNPRAWFDSLSAAEQDKQFTKAGAQAIRDGGDISQVVNARRGAYGLTPAGARITAEEARAIRGGRARGRLEAVDVYGRQLFVTNEGVTTRGLAGRRLGARDGSKQGRYRAAKTPRLMPESIYQIAGNDRAEALRLLKRFGYII
ncbi:VG15 protein [Micromonospora zhanjiangensis]|uniref:Phage Mu protein F like protein n=1 Tax=Micromonospora zhanjiangensis TaxID=1522057 RepID=A0ABV8KNW5_9ACTN